MPEVTLIPNGVLEERARAAMRVAVEQTDEELVGLQMADCPVDTGTLRASIHIEEIADAGDTITATNATGGEANAYAALVHEGTGPHIIEPKTAQALSWPGADHPVKIVHHPGTRPNPFMASPLLGIVGTFERNMAAAASMVF